MLMSVLLYQGRVTLTPIVSTQTGLSCVTVDPGLLAMDSNAKVNDGKHYLTKEHIFSFG